MKPLGCISFILALTVLLSHTLKHTYTQTQTQTQSPRFIFLLLVFLPQYALTIQSVVEWTLPTNFIVLSLNIKSGFLWSLCWWCFKQSQTIVQSRCFDPSVPRCSLPKYSLLSFFGYWGHWRTPRVSLSICIPLFLSIDWTYTLCSLLP